MPVKKNPDTGLARVELAPILDAPISTADLNVPLPPELASLRPESYHEVTSDLEPTVKWEVIGQYIIGRFAGAKEMELPDKERGKRHQWIYYLTIPDGRKVGVWGSTILDRMMADAVRAGLRENQSLAIQWVRDIKTDQPSPAKDFRVIWR